MNKGLTPLFAKASVFLFIQTNGPLRPTGNAWLLTCYLAPAQYIVEYKSIKT